MTHFKGLLMAACLVVGAGVLTHGQSDASKRLTGSWAVVAEGRSGSFDDLPTQGVLLIDALPSALRGTLTWNGLAPVALTGATSGESFTLVGPWTDGMRVNGTQIQSRVEIRGQISSGGDLSGTIAFARKDTDRLVISRGWRAKRTHAVASAGQPKAGETTIVPAASDRPIQTRLDEALQAVVDEQRLVGATAAAVVDGRVMTSAKGFADAARTRSMRPTDRLLAGSVGKTFVAALALLLEHDGRLNLDAPVSEWLGGEPWFSRLPNAPALTMRLLLSHRAGVPNHVALPAFAAAIKSAGPDRLTHGLSPVELVEFILDKPALFPAGSGFHYSDTGYIIAGMALERLIQRPYYAELEHRILRPLALTATTPSDKVVLDGLVPGHLDRDNALGLPSPIVSGGALVINPRTEWTGGGLISTSSDLARWMQALFTAASWKALGEKMSRTESPDGQYGLGLSVQNGPHGKTFGHSGWFPGYRSEVAFVPSLNLSIAFQTNTDRADGGRALARLLDAVRGR